MFERSWSTWWRHMVFDDGFVIYAGGATWTLVSGEGLRDTGTTWMTTFAVLGARRLIFAAPIQAPQGAVASPSTAADTHAVDPDTDPGIPVSRSA